VKVEKIAADFLKKEEHADPEVQVQHILIAFRGAGRSEATRSRDEAAGLVYDLIKKIKGGADFTELMKAHSEDPGPGTYTMVLDAANVVQGENYPRQGMVAAFGDAGWRLAVGEVGLADFDAQRSPFGYHIVKRLK
jgi:parvulin-like peptidyl-prolyl isomerase